MFFKALVIFALSLVLGPYFSCISPLRALRTVFISVSDSAGLALARSSGSTSAYNLPCVGFIRSAFDRGFVCRFVFLLLSIASSFHRPPSVTACCQQHLRQPSSLVGLASFYLLDLLRDVPRILGRMRFRRFGWLSCALSLG